MKYYEVGKDIKVETFDSVTEFARIISTRKPNRAFAKALRFKEFGWRDFSSVDGDKSSTCTASFEEAQNLLQHGDRENCKQLLKARGTVSVTGDAVTRSIRRGYVGGAPCVPAAILGHPRAMYNREKRITKQPVINLYGLVFMPHCFTCESIIAGGRKLLSLVVYLEQRGIRVNLYTVKGIKTSRGKQAFCVVKIKDCTMPLNTQLVAYPLVNPSYNRRHSWRWTETSPCTNYAGFTDGYGFVLFDALDFERANIIDENGYFVNPRELIRLESIDDMLYAIGIKL